MAKLYFLPSMFQSKALTFERMITHFGEFISSPSYEKFVLRNDGRYKIKGLLHEEKTFKKFSTARYATDEKICTAPVISGVEQERRKGKTPRTIRDSARDG